MTDPVRESAIALLTDWSAPDAAQDALRHSVLAFLLGREDSCRRSCVPGHITASALVVADAGDQVPLAVLVEVEGDTQGLAAA